MEKTLDEIKQEGIKLDDKTDEELDNLPEEEEETSTESSTENKQEENATSGEEEDKIPFHKHPRFQEVIAQKNELFEKNKLLEERLSRIESLEETKKNENIPARPDWFTKLYGADEVADEAWGLYYQNEVQREIERENRVYTRIKNEQEQETSQYKQAEIEAENYINQSIQQLKDEGNQFDIKELIAVVKKYTPTDENNNLDFRKGLEILQAIKKDNPLKQSARKEIASSTISPTKQTSNEKQFGTTINLRNRSFSSLTNED